MLTTNKFFNFIFILLTLSTICYAQYWTGDGRNEMSLGIFVPESQGLNANQTYLPSMIQGCLVANISKYSAISVLDRVSLDKVLTETLDPIYEDNFDIVRLGHVAHVGYIMTGSIIRTSTGYTLQVNVTDTTPNARTIASYSGTCTAAQLDDQTAIQKASLDLLIQMGVRLTDIAINELSTANSQQAISAQTALAHGITAQKQGTLVEALSYYIQANNYDANLGEAASRFNILSANISSGNIGEDIRNDIAWRRHWVALLQETEILYSNYIKNQPYYLIYDTYIMQGNIDYQKETVELSFYMGLFPDASWVNTINEVTGTVKTGLQTTGRAGAWGLDWPNKSVSTVTTFVDQENEYVVVTEILNSEGVSIGRRSNTLGYGNMNREGLLTPFWAGGLVTFPAVDANKITDQLTFRIVSINGRAVENFARDNNINIMTVAEYNIIPTVINNGMDLNNISNFTYDSTGTKLVSYSGPTGKVIIPVIVNGFLVNDPFYRIYTFRNKGITNIVIPSTFATIPQGDPFGGNPLTTISIGLGVNMSDGTNLIGGNAFDRNFIRFYNDNGKKAGTYSRNGSTWTFTPR